MFGTILTRSDSYKKTRYGLDTTPKSKRATLVVRLRENRFLVKKGPGPPDTFGYQVGRAPRTGYDHSALSNLTVLVWVEVDTRNSSIPIG